MDTTITNKNKRRKPKVFTWPRRTVQLLLCRRRLVVIVGVVMWKKRKMMNSKFNMLLPVHHTTQTMSELRNLLPSVKQSSTKPQHGKKPQLILRLITTVSKVVITGAFCGFSLATARDASASFRCVVFISRAHRSKAKNIQISLISAALMR